MNKYKNRGLDMEGLSYTDPVRYRKIYAVLTDKNKTKEDLLDMVEIVPLENVHHFAGDGSTTEDAVHLSELKTEITKVLVKLTPREERVLRKRFGIGKMVACTLEECAIEFRVTKERIRQIEAKALRKLKHPSRAGKLVEFLDAA